MKKLVGPAARFTRTIDRYPPYAPAGVIASG
jgi:hypothetical protein